ncbi:putative barttin [Triplophysa rosa]|uniref:Barttin n=1 Tax=Triplophysa rosa TaxID=992332 RepID=A0A9W7TMW1_TRIRA|nr:putative barttin [Triplophysa rosa]
MFNFMFSSNATPILTAVDSVDYYCDGITRRGQYVFQEQMAGFIRALTCDSWCGAHYNTIYSLHWLGSNVPGGLHFDPSIVPGLQTQSRNCAGSLHSTPTNRDLLHPTSSTCSAKVTLILPEKEELCAAERQDPCAVESLDEKSPTEQVKAPLAGFCDDEKVDISADPQLHTVDKHKERAIVLHTSQRSSDPSTLASSSTPLPESRTSGPAGSDREMYYGKVDDSCYTSDLDSE